jgi:hypothetical protein
MGSEKAKRVPDGSSRSQSIQREMTVMRLAVGMALLNATILRPHRGKRILRTGAQVSYFFAGAERRMAEREGFVHLRDSVATADLIVSASHPP